MKRLFNPLVGQLGLILFSTLTCCLCLSRGSAQTKAAFELHSGDRVVFVGDTLIEREQSYGYLEERLTAQFPDQNIIFRNLGWSADTPAGESRASFDFDKPGRGFELLKQEIAAVQPTVVFIGYGMASSFQGAGGMPDFRAQLNKLVDMIQATSTSGPVRIIFLSPLRHENLGAPLPDPTLHNEQLSLYTRVVATIAEERKSTFISLYDILASSEIHPLRPLTDDGIHLTGYGYARLADAVEKSFLWGDNDWRVEITSDGQAAPGSYGTSVSNIQREKDKLRFTTLDTHIVKPVLPDQDPALPSPDSTSTLIVSGLKSGHYDLKIDGVFAATGTGREWARGIVIEHGPQFDQAEQLRQAILKKNQLHFDRWRPENETYLFGFRRHEQGQNAKEIPMFDKLIADEETKIAKLRQPVAHTFELVAVSRAHVGKVETEFQAVNSELPTPKQAQQLPEFDIAPGFEISLYAESPLLAKPIQMNFDPRGRLWVVSSSVYPQIQPGQEADDKVLLLEDTTGAGKADKSTVFAEGLLIPTGVEPGDGGVYVSQGTQLLFFKDTHGSGKADSKRVVLSGFGTEDTHHILHTLNWGPDGQLYFDQSIYIHSHIETPHGVERLNSGGVWHLRPPTMELGVFLRGFCNPWGHQFDEYGQSFVTDGAGGQGLTWGITGATYFTYASMRRELQSVSPGSYPKFCALELIQSQQFPDDWQGNAITCDFRAHRVVRFAIDEKDSGYITREMPDLLRTTNVTFRPIDVKMGPDGALYIADWSNPIIQHGEVDFRDPRRDHEHGRIWRVTAKGRPLVPRPQLVNAPNRELFDQLFSSNRYNIQQSRRVLTERGAAIGGDLEKWSQKQTDEKALLQALWLWQSIDQTQPALLEKLLNAKDGHIRAAATRVLSYWHSRLPNAMELLTQRVGDDFPRVRVEALRALAEIPTAKSAELVLGALDQALDPFVEYAVWLSINDLAKPWVAAVQSGEWKPEGHEKQLEYALKAIEPADAGAVLSQVLKTRPLTREGSGPWIELIGESGTGAELRRLFTQATTGGFDEAGTVRALNALSKAARERNAGKSDDVAQLASLFKSDKPEVRAAALNLAGAWKRPALVPEIVATINREAAVKNEPINLAVIKAGCESLREIGGRAAVMGLEKFIKEAGDAAARREAVLALAALDAERAKQPVIDALNELKDADAAAEFWRSLLGIKDLSATLAKSLPKSGLSPVMAKAGLRVAREGGRNETELVVALTRGADLEGQGLGLTDADMKQLGVRASSEGDPKRGEMLFRRADLSCIKCHAIGGVGGKVGPDMTSIGASAPIDYLIESVFYPNRKIKEGFHSILVETKDGEELAGILASENNEQLVLRDATGKEVSIAKNNIKSRALGNSLMPSGLVDGLSAAQQMDLFRFLSELGKPGPFDASKGNVARLWKLYPETVDAAQFGVDQILHSQLSDLHWATAFSLVDGRLLNTELEAALKAAEYRYPKGIYAAARVQVSGGEKFAVKLTGANPGTPLWLDGKPVTGEELDAAPGQHTIVLKLDAAKLPEYVRLEVSGATFLTN